MTLIQRIFGGFFILVIALLTLVGVNYYSIDTIQEDISSITDETLPLSDSASEIRANILVQNQNIMSVFSTIDSAEIEAYENEFTATSDSTVNLIEGISPAMLSRNSSLNRELSSIKEQMQAYRQQALTLTSLHKNNTLTGAAIRRQFQVLSSLKRRLTYYLDKYSSDEYNNSSFRLAISGIAREANRILNAFDRYLVDSNIDALTTSVQGSDIVIEKNFNAVKQYDVDTGKLFSLMITPVLYQLRSENGLYSLYLKQAQDREQIRALIQRNNQVTDALISSVDGFVAQTKGMLRQAEDSTGASIGLIQQTMFTISLISLVIAIAVPLLISSSIRKALSNFRSALLEMTKGDFRVQFIQSTKDEFGELGGYLNGLADNLRTTFTSLNSSVDELTNVANNNVSISERTNEAVAQQRRLLESTASAMTEMESSVAEVAQRAHDTMMAAEQANDQMNSVGQSITQAITNIKEQAEQIEQTSVTAQELNDYGKKIDSIIETIQDIAEQTNLLALNAAIEAARAGEQGRGFAVVADEVRNLASRTKSSTEEIQSMIEVMQKLIQAVVDIITLNVSRNDTNISVAEQAEQGLHQMDGLIKQIVEMNMQIAAATEEQSSTAKEISASVVHISDSAEETSRGAEDNAEASQFLREQSNQQRQLIGKFEV